MRISLIHRGAGLFVSGLFALTGCSEQKQPQQAAPAAQVPASQPAPAPNIPPVASSPDRTEYLDWATARLNGQVPLQSTPQAVWQVLGQPDSLVIPDWEQECVSFFSRTFRRGYARGTTVEVYGDTAVVTSLDLQHQPTLRLHVGALRLSHNTSLTDLAKSFPRAVRQQSPLDDYYLGRVTEVALATGQPLSDDHWELLFKNGKLVRIDYWMPC